MNNYRVYLTWSDGEISVRWVDAKNASHACFRVGHEVAETGVPSKVIVDVAAVLETN